MKKILVFSILIFLSFLYLNSIELSMAKSVRMKLENPERCDFSQFNYPKEELTGAPDGGSFMSIGYEGEITGDKVNIINSIVIKPGSSYSFEYNPASGMLELDCTVENGGNGGGVPDCEVTTGSRCYITSKFKNDTKNLLFFRLLS